jgi:hypothetical protein
MDRRFDIAWILLWGLLSSAWCVTAARDLSATFDEPFYLQSGMESWRSGSNYALLRVGTMPLPIDVEYLPLYIWEQVRGEPFDLNTDFRTILTYARMGNLWFWWLLLIYTCALARLFGGPWAGRFAVLIIATEPNLLGHACLATTDIAITAMMVTFTYYYVSGRESNSRWRRWVLPGLLYGLAMATKASAFTFVPIIMFAVELPRWKEQGLFNKPKEIGWVRHLWRITSEFRFLFAKILTVGTIVAWGYCGSDWKPQSSFVKLADNMTDETWKPVVGWTARNLSVFPNAGEGLVYQIKHNIRGHGAYLLGDWHPRAVRHYFPVAMSIKLTLAVWALIVGLLLFRPRSLFNVMGLAFLLLFVFSATYRVQIGIRLIFPLLALLYIIIAIGLAKTTTEWQPRSRALLFAVLIGILSYPPLKVWPDGLRYANELWGGPDDVHLYLGDSNCDWGQGVFDLDRWTDEHGLPRAKAVYHGHEPTLVKNPDRLMPLHFPQYKIEKPEDTLQYVRGHVVAVNLMLLYGNPEIHPQLTHALKFFHQQTPAGRSRSFFIYDFR